MRNWKSYLVVVISMQLCSAINGQMKKMPVAALESAQIQGFTCLDTAYNLSTVCPTYMDRMYVTFYAAEISEKKELHLIGRVSISGPQYSIGLSGCEIMIGKLQNGLFTNVSKINVATYAGSNDLNGGFFDIMFKPQTGTVLIFKEPTHFLVSYRMDKALLKWRE